jgi:cell division protein FtsB
MPQARRTFIQRVIKWRFFFVVNLLLIIFLGMTLGREFFRTREIQNEINELQAQADSLSARNIMLSELQIAVQTESFIEREARLKLGMKKPGEEVVVVKDGEVEQKVAEGSSEGSEDPLGLALWLQEDQPRVANATKWWYYFFNKSAFRVLLTYDD